MKYNNIFKTIITTIFIIAIAGCTPSTFNNMSTQKEVIIKKKEIVYSRDDISKELTNRVYAIIHAMSTNNLTLINTNFINKDFGFYNLFKIEGNKVFTEQKMIYNIIEEETEEVFHLIKRVSKNSNKLKVLHKNIKFNCSPNDDTFYGWNDDGLYIKDYVKPILSSLMKDTNKYQIGKYSEEDLLKAKLIELTSYKVIVTPDLSFTLTKLDNLWYITSMDRITTDCSSPKEY
jgi:hypothetical protein